MRKQFLLPGFLAILLFFTTCRKDNSSSKQDLHAETVAKIDHWLDAQVSASNEAAANLVQKLKDQLDLTGLRFETLNRGEQLIIIPVRPGFQTLYRAVGQPVNVLLLILDNTAAIRKGNIVQYRAENGQAVIPSGTFFKFYNNQPLEADAAFSFLSLTGRLLHEIGYKEGNVNSFGMATARAVATAVNGPVQDPIGPAPVCTDWYLVTTYYYADGSTEQTEEFLYTTCESGGGGGGNGSENEEAMLLSAQADWIVAESQVWKVWSTEQFTGVKVPGELGGGHFKSITHSNVVINARAFNWTLSGAVVSLSTPQIATSGVSGIVRANDGSYSEFIPTKYQIFTFSQIFP